MSLTIRLLPEAKAEFDDAADWYERRRIGLGQSFIACVRRTLDRISANPQLYAPVYGSVRKASVSRFPYVILYREELGDVIVISVFHTSRDPSIWKGRT
jgi:plasmid stabilization system protein ParE